MRPQYYENNFEIKFLREYVRIQSVHPDVDYEPCVEFLKQQAVFLDLPFAVYYPSKRTKPVVVITWPGLKPDLPSIMFNSHMDVVPVFREEWSFPPFAAEINLEGLIYGRGVQGAKTNGMQYLAAIRFLKKQGFQGQRTAHITFMPDQEIGGTDGMKRFVLTNAFRNLNIAFATDTGYPSETDVMPLFYGERIKHPAEATFTIRGTSGDASMMPKNTASEKFNFLLNKLMLLRKEQNDLLKSNTKLRQGDITAINLTKTITAPTSNNLPPIIEATFDIRLAVNVDPYRFSMQLKQYCEEAGGGIQMQLSDPDFKRGVTVLDENNIYWVAMKNALEEENVAYEPQIFHANTDMKYIRDETINIPAINFSPIPNSPILIHSHDEFLLAETYLRGIEIWARIMSALLDAGVEVMEESSEQ